MDVGEPEDGCWWARSVSLCRVTPRTAESEPSLSLRGLALENGPDELGTSVSLTQTSRC